MNHTHTALVLGGGGSAGNAWLIGLIAGLSDAGLDLTAADLIIGTSAGATAAAQITGASPAQLLADILDAPPLPQRPGASGDHLARLTRVIAESSDIADLRRRMGPVALEANVDGAWWRSTVAARLARQDWPEQNVQLTAVNAVTAEPVVFDRSTGVELVDAVAASCAGGFAYRIGDGSYIDGGYRANADNADLASGFDHVLVLSPLGGRSLHPEHWGTHLATQVERLRADGSAVETVFPDAAALAAFGDNMMNPATRVPAARAGFDQARILADPLARFWAE